MPIDFTLTPEQQRLRADARAFARDVLSKVGAATQDLPTPLARFAATLRQVPGVGHVSMGPAAGHGRITELDVQLAANPESTAAFRIVRRLETTAATRAPCTAGTPGGPGGHGPKHPRAGAFRPGERGFVGRSADP